MTWVSSDPDVATVSPDGVVTAVGPGEAEITAQYKDKVSEPVKVVVSGIAVESGFGTALSEHTTNNTITLKAYGDAKISEPTPTIEPEGAVTLTPTKNSDGSITYKIAKGSIAANTSCTINFGDGTKPFTFTYVDEEVTVDVDGDEVIAGIEPDKETVIDISSALKDDDEIAKITTDDGKVIYDVNNPENTEDGYEYDPDNKTLTIPEGITSDLTINAEKVKILLYDALLTTNGRNYTRPTFKADNLKGKYAHIDDAITATGDMTFAKGIYFRLIDDFTEESFNFISAPSFEVTIDLNGHYLSKGDPNGSYYTRLINALIGEKGCFNIIDGTLKDNNLGANSDILGAAIYAVNTSKNNLNDNNWADSIEEWGVMNIFDVTFSDNYADCGGAICINGAVQLNIFDSVFTGNRSSSTGGKNNSRPYGTGSAIFVYHTGYRGEIVNIYDSKFNGNTGSNLFSMDSTSGMLFNIYGGNFTGNTFSGNGALMWISAFNIYGGDFTGNKKGELASGITDPSLLYVGGDGYASQRSDVSINGGIMNGGDDFSSINLNTTKDNNHDRISFNGGSADSLVWSAGTNTPETYDLSQKGLALASVNLGTTNKVEYVTYEGGTVNINSPFKIDRNGDVHYKFENGYDRISGDEFNGSEFNPAIDTFNVFLPSDKIGSINSITVHFAEGSPVTLSKTVTEGSVEFK